MRDKERETQAIQDGGADQKCFGGVLSRREKRLSRQWMKHDDKTRRRGQEHIVWGLDRVYHRWR